MYGLSLFWILSLPESNEKLRENLVKIGENDIHGIHFNWFTNEVMSTELDTTPIQETQPHWVESSDVSKVHGDKLESAIPTHESPTPAREGHSSPFRKERFEEYQKSVWLDEGGSPISPLFETKKKSPTVEKEAQPIQSGGKEEIPQEMENKSTREIGKEKEIPQEEKVSEKFPGAKKKTFGGKLKKRAQRASRAMHDFVSKIGSSEKTEPK